MHTRLAKFQTTTIPKDPSMTTRLRTALRRRGLLLGGAALVLPLALPPLAHAQAFPAKPITLIVPWPAGGSTDRHLRALAEIASKNLGQIITVDNRPGGGGTTGPGTMALTARPDGYTIAQYPMGMLRVPHMQKVQWDPLKDFTFIIGVSGYTFGFTVRSDSPYKTFNDYVEAARKEPGKIDYGSTGIGTSPHLLMEELAGNARIALNHVPFKGNADLTQALLGGHVMAMSDATGWDKFVDGGQMRLLVTFGEQRTRRWPNVPTAKDLGYNVVATSPYGFVGPKGMDPAVVKTLHDAFKKAMDDPKHLEVLAQLNQDLWYRSGDDYAKWARETYAKDKALIERLGLAAK
jgi:tripartite-type tricarboxylate transporter receptor subunit TctC